MHTLEQVLRARNLVDVMGDIANQEYARAYDLYTRAPSTMLAAYQGATNTLQGNTAGIQGGQSIGQAGYNAPLMAQMQADQTRTQLMGDLGQGLGMLAGGKPGGGKPQGNG